MRTMSIAAMVTKRPRATRRNKRHLATRAPTPALPRKRERAVPDARRDIILNELAALSIDTTSSPSRSAARPLSRLRVGGFASWGEGLPIGESDRPGDG
jgi:hypothetical protein